MEASAKDVHISAFVGTETERLLRADEYGEGPWFVFIEMGLLPRASPACCLADWQRAGLTDSRHWAVFIATYKSIPPRGRLAGAEQAVGKGKEAARSREKWAERKWSVSQSGEMWRWKEDVLCGPERKLTEGVRTSKKDFLWITCMPIFCRSPLWSEMLLL